MAKPTFTKLKLSSDIAPKELEWGEQKIEIKQYISIQDKLTLIGDVLNSAADENRFYNIGKINMFFALKVLDYYTNLSITDKQKENPVKLYDDIIASGFYGTIFKLIPEDEIGFVYNTMIDTIEQVYKYQNSAYGIMDTISQDYNNLNLDATKISEKLSNKENVEFLNQVLTKMG